MSKILIGLIIGIVIGISGTALATSYPANGVARTIKGAECTYVTGDDGQSYPSECNVNIDKFQDGQNVCYVTVGGTGDNIPAISCVKGNN